MPPRTAARFSEHHGIATETVSWFQAAFSWTGAVAAPGVGTA